MDTGIFLQQLITKMDIIDNIYSVSTKCCSSVAYYKHFSILLS